jgi:hypothetical protein
VFGAFFEGWRRVRRAPVFVLSVTLAMLLVSAPLAIRPGDLVGRDFTSTIQTSLAQVTAAWAGDQHESSSSEAGAALHAILGVGVTLPAAYVLFWALLAGGILDRLARGRPVGTAQFFAACGVYLTRFARLGVVIGAAYAMTFLLLRPRSGMVPFLAFLATLALVGLIADFAKVRAVVEDRRSMIGALAAALRFIRHHPVSTVVLYSMNLLTAVALVLLWERVIFSAANAARRWWPFSPGSASCSFASSRGWRSWRRRSCSSRAGSRTRATPRLPNSSGRTHPRSRRSTTWRPGKNRNVRDLT